jgi:hypothetical protein
VDRLIAVWRAAPRAGATDEQGFFEADLVHGEYKVTVSHPELNNSISRRVNVELGSGSENLLR